MKAPFDLLKRTFEEARGLDQDGEVRQVGISKRSPIGRLMHAKGC